METEQLISEVEKRPVLWNTSDESYKDRKKNEAWLNVTSALHENLILTNNRLNMNKKQKCIILLCNAWQFK